MYKAEFDRLLQGELKAQNFILFGQSSFYIDYYSAKLSKIEDAQKLIFYFDEYDYSLAKRHLSEASLFGGVNLLVIKSEKKIPKRELEELFRLCNKGANRFIYAYYGSDHKSYNNAFKSLGVVSVRFFDPKPNEALAILTQEATKRNLAISNHTLMHLLTIQDMDVALALNELEKLALLPLEKITPKEVDRVVYGAAEADLYRFVKEFWQKREYAQQLQKLLQSGEDPLRILTALSSALFELYLFNIYIRANGAADAKEILGYKPPETVVKEKSSAAVRIKSHSYYKLMRTLLEAELKMKSSHSDKEAILLSTLLRLHKNF